MSVWDNIKHFSKNENWGDPDRVSPLLLLVLDEIRDAYGKPFIVHCAYETSGHAKKSYHYLGSAVDFHIEDSLPFPDQVEKLLYILKKTHIAIITTSDTHANVWKIPYKICANDVCGLGIYPDWKHPGFHLDVRGYKARWGRIGNVYVAFDKALEYAKEKWK